MYHGAGEQAEATSGDDWDGVGGKVTGNRPWKEESREHDESFKWHWIQMERKAIRSKPQQDEVKTEVQCKRRQDFAAR